MVTLTNGASLSLPVAIVSELRGATRAQLRDIEILPGGDGLHWPALDFTISVPGLAASLFRPAVWMSELGRWGGSRVTVAKAAAARRNGLRGGRPRSDDVSAQKRPGAEVNRLRLSRRTVPHFRAITAAHFHVRYAEYRATLSIDASELLEGQLPPRVLGLVAEWAALHRFELRRNWTLLATEGKFQRIAPLV